MWYNQFGNQEFGEVMTVKIIETKRMILKPLTINDAKDVFEWTGDPIVNRYMPYPLHKNVHQTEEWISTLGDKNEFAFSLKDTGKVIGSGSITYRTEYKAYELGYNLNRKFWGKGYATEAAKAMIQWAYQILSAHDFFARHANANKASGNVITKCGFQFDKYGQYSRYDGSEMFEASYYTLHLE
ncbi:MAG: GNAT family N-acetyltransferase [Ruminococcaceae bacterium]|nr:GNAT family N-acetyltransferase [Oscillospiraceae bacterium]